MQHFNKNPIFIKELFNSISNNYDKLNDIMSFGLHRKIKKDVIKQSKVLFENPPFNCLDLCCGTGDLSGILKKGFTNSKVTGVDFSKNMLEIAKRKHPGIEFLEADITNLPFEDESFDLCIISFGLRNVENIDAALKEIYRVLKHGGVFINIDLGKPNKFFNIFLKPYMYFWVAFLGKIFHGDETPYKYLAESNETFPSPYELMQAFMSIGFSKTENKNFLFGQIAAQFSIK